MTLIRNRLFNGGDGFLAARIAIGSDAGERERRRSLNHCRFRAALSAPNVLSVVERVWDM